MSINTTSKQATRLEDIWKTVTPEPLLDEEGMKAYYCADIQQVRGVDTIGKMRLGLNRAHGGNPYKAFVMGHAGVGKSTELTRLLGTIGGKFKPIRFSATKELDPISFQPFDVLLLMVAEMVEQTRAAGLTPDEDALK